MTPTGKKIAVVGGAVVAAGLVILLLPKKADAKILPGASSSPLAAKDAYAVLDKAAQLETDVSLLRDIRDKVLAASLTDHRWNPYFTKIQARLEFISPVERTLYIQQAGGGGTMSLAQALAKK